MATRDAEAGPLLLDIYRGGGAVLVRSAAEAAGGIGIGVGICLADGESEIGGLVLWRGGVESRRGDVDGFGDVCGHVWRLNGEERVRVGVTVIVIVNSLVARALWEQGKAAVSRIFEEDVGFHQSTRDVAEVVRLLMPGKQEVAVSVFSVVQVLQMLQVGRGRGLVEDGRGDGSSLGGGLARKTKRGNVV